MSIVSDVFSLSGPNKCLFLPNGLPNSPYLPMTHRLDPLFFCKSISLTLSVPLLKFVLDMKKYIMDVHGFQESNITVLMDDGNHIAPTRENILNAYNKIVSESRSGDVVFCHYSGHGGKMKDDNGDEKDGHDEVRTCLNHIPVVLSLADIIFTPH
jgi:hypothetical protein